MNMFKNSWRVVIASAGEKFSRVHKKGEGEKVVRVLWCMKGDGKKPARVSNAHYGVRRESGFHSSSAVG